MKKIKTAVVGVGYLGKFHVQKYAQLAQADLIAVCDAQPKQAQELADQYQLKALTDYRELAGQVEAVSIAAPTLLHYEIALFFLKHGIHVLVEKPITTTLAQAEELINVAAQEKLILQVGHIERFNAGFKQLRTLSKEPYFLEACRLAPFKLRGADVSVILDLMIHDLDLIQSLVPKPIQDIKAAGMSLITHDIDIAEVKLEFNDGCLAFIKASRAHPTIQRHLTVYQKDEYLHLDMHSKSLKSYTRNAELQEALAKEIAIPNEDALYSQIDAFLNAILGLQPVVVSGEDGFNALDLSLRISSMIHGQ